MCPFLPVKLYYSIILKDPGQKVIAQSGANSDLVINSKNESIFWALFIFINAKLGNLGIRLSGKNKLYWLWERLGEFRD